MITGEKLNLADLDEKPILAIICLAHDNPGVYRQVTLRKDKVSKVGLIRFGETQGDEARGWQDPEFVYVVERIGVVDIETNQVTPF